MALPLPLGYAEGERMAASTRSGIPGGFSGGDGPTDTQSARTLFGHDLHLAPGSVDVSPAPTPDPPVEEPSRPVTTEEEFTAPANLVSHSGKSRFPPLAQLFGRWNTQGQFENNLDEDLDVIPRERFLRPLAIVVATAAISFFIVVALLKLRDSTTGPAPVPPAPVAAAPAPRPVAPPTPVAAAPAPRPVPPPTPVAAAPAPRPVAAAPAPRPVAPPPAPRAAPAAPERSRPVSDDLDKAVAQRDAARAAAKPAKPRRPRAPVAAPADPDSPLPLSF
jgi:hypothetical protein